jgi:hypothetical protein
MIELSAEALQTRKAFHRSRLRVGVTDRAYRTRVVGELKLVASDAGRVTGLTGKADTRRIGIAAMT